ncbi:MAG: proteasome assembly chaperone family protein [Methanobacterium sp.]|jgi:uncharacterized protein
MVEMVVTEVGCCKIISKDVENAIVLEGSPELGLIGNILGWLLVNELNMEQIGYIDSKYFPPLAVLYKGKAIHPFRVYATDGIVMFLSDFIIPPKVTYDMTNGIVDWMNRNNSKEIITFNSILVKGKVQGVAGVANSDQSLERLGKLNVPILPFGNIAGLSGTLLTRSIQKGIAGSCLFAEVLSPYPDPRAAANVINVLNKMIGTEVNAEPLIKEAEEIESRLQELSQHIQSEPGSQMYI